MSAAVGSRPEFESVWSLATIQPTVPLYCKLSDCEILARRLGLRSLTVFSLSACLLVAPLMSQETAMAVAEQPTLLWMKESMIRLEQELVDRKSTRLNSSHVKISYAV